MINLATALATATIVFSSMFSPFSPSSSSKSIKKGGNIAALTITSPAFAPGGMIPEKYTCKGTNINPPIHVEGIPAGTRSMVLILDDPDAPMDGGFTHWVIWNIDPTMPDIPEAYHGAVQGFNSGKKKGYTGPCPPQGTHHYHFQVYALRKLMNIPPDSYKERVVRDMKGLILAQGELIGLYSKSNK